MQNQKGFRTPPKTEAADPHLKTLQTAIAFHQQGKLSEAKQLYEEILLKTPNHFDALHLSGVIASQSQMRDEAEVFYAKAIRINPKQAAPHYNLGKTLQDQKCFDKALQSYDTAISLKSDYAEAFYNRGVTLQQLRRFDEALQSYDQAIAIKSDYAGAFNNRGNTLSELKRFAEALQSYDKAVSIKSDYAEAFNNRGNTLKELKRFSEALQSYNKALAINSDYAEVLLNRGFTLQELKRFDESLQDYDKAISIKPYFFDAQSNRLLLLNYVSCFSASYRLEAARKFGADVVRFARQKFTHSNVENSFDKLRLGFVSGDFRVHSVGFFLEGFLSNLDQTKFELIGYTNNSFEDELTLRLKSFFGLYKSLVGLGDEEAAKAIYDDDVQILIDLSGHTALNRLPVFAHKPAAVQLSWLGYCGTTGVDEIDYILGDSYVTPPSEENHFSEKIKRLPENYICMTPPNVGVEVHTLSALKNGYITFGCFNNFSKVNESVIRLWARIMLQVHGSRLFLKAGQLADTSVIRDTVSMFQSLGISSERLSFEGHKNPAEHFDAYNKVDIGLDTFPYNGVTTTAEALWMGVPVLTKKGDCFVSHNGETICHHTGLSDWIAEDENDYYEKAVRFSSDFEALAKLRAGLREKILTSPLFAAERFARRFEDAMFELWSDYNMGR